MSKTMNRLASEASFLSARERATLAERLVEGLVARPSPAVERAWAAEAQRRLAEVRAGKATLIPGDEGTALVRRLVAR